MPWTQTELDALESSIQRGTRVVQFGDRRVEYHSLDEMLKLRQLMREEVETAAGTRTRVSYAQHSKE